MFVAAECLNMMRKLIWSLDLTRHGSVDDLSGAASVVWWWQTPNVHTLTRELRGEQVISEHKPITHGAFFQKAAEKRYGNWR